MSAIFDAQTQGVEGKLDPYPIEKENLLLAEMKNGDPEAAQRTLDALLDLLLLQRRTETDYVKRRVMALSVLLSRSAMERGAEVRSMLQTEDRLLQAILAADNAEEACNVLREGLSSFEAGLLLPFGRGNRSIRLAIAYIAGHYGEALTLEQVADHIHLNASYLSFLFKKVTDANFREYLNRVRINEARRLLLYTDIPIVEISTICGFNDQSYFTKVFKKRTGMTPKQYRSWDGGGLA